VKKKWRRDSDSADEERIIRLLTEYPEMGIILKWKKILRSKAD
jgi:hypothetical protein